MLNIAINLVMVSIIGLYSGASFRAGANELGMSLFACIGFYILYVSDQRKKEKLKNQIDGLKFTIKQCVCQDDNLGVLRWQMEGHTYHCACRIEWGDGECECNKTDFIPGELSSKHYEGVCLVCLQNTEHGDSHEAWCRNNK